MGQAEPVDGVLPLCQLRSRFLQTSARLPLLSHDALASGHEIGEQLLGLKGDVLHELPDRLLQGLGAHLEVAAGRTHVGAMLAGIGGRASWLLLREHGRTLDPRVLARAADQAVQ